MSLIIKHRNEAEKIVHPADTDEGMSAVVAVGIYTESTVEDNTDVAGLLFPCNDAVILPEIADTARVHAQEIGYFFIGNALKELTFLDFSPYFSHKIFPPVEIILQEKSLPCAFQHTVRAFYIIYYLFN